MTLSLAVLISGTGSNLGAILAAIDAGRCDARVTAVLSDRGNAPGLERASSRNIPTQIVRMSEHADRGAWDVALADAVSGYSPDLVVLAGFMKIVGPAMLARFAGRIVNVHPALLPAFPGGDGPAQAIRARVRISGCTVHVVDGGVDTGPILAQAAVPVLPDDDEATLHQRIQRAEHRLMPAVIDGIARGKIVLTMPPTIAPFPEPERATLISPPLDEEP